MDGNGRINILNSNGQAFNFADKIPIKEICNYNNALRGTWVDTPLSILFFSKENIELLQKNIIIGVYKKSNKQILIDEQSCDELKIIMRSIYLQNSHNLSYDITKQIQELNCLVLTYAINQIYKSAISYLKYKIDVSNAPEIMQTPISSNTKDVLEFKGFF